MKRVIATQTAERRTRFECRSCGHRCAAIVRTEGAGTELVGASEQRATRKAADAAERDLESNVKSMLRLARCPKCGKRNALELLRLASWTFVPALVMCGLAYPLVKIGGVAELVAVALGAAAVGNVVVGVRALRRAERDVELESDA